MASFRTFKTLLEKLALKLHNPWHFAAAHVVKLRTSGLLLKTSGLLLKTSYNQPTLNSVASCSIYIQLQVTDNWPVQKGCIGGRSHPAVSS